VVLAHVPLADVGRGISRSLERSRIAGQVVGVLGEVVAHAVRVRIDAAEEARAARRAERIGHERVREPYALVGDAVHVRRFEIAVSGAAQAVPALIVGNDEDDIRRTPRRTATGQRGGRAGGGRGEELASSRESHGRYYRVSWPQRRLRLHHEGAMTMKYM